MNIGDSVIYTENEKDHVATVLEIRYLENHLGKSGEPLLQLGFFDSVFKPGPNGIPTRVSVFGTHEQGTLAQFRTDVAHTSHEFQDSKLTRYPGGRWSEATVIRNPEIFDVQPGIDAPLEVNQQYIAEQAAKANVQEPNQDYINGSPREVVEWAENQRKLKEQEVNIDTHAGSTSTDAASTEDHTAEQENQTENKES